MPTPDYDTTIPTTSSSPASPSTSLPSLHLPHFSRKKKAKTEQPSASVGDGHDDVQQGHESDGGGQVDKGKGVAPGEGPSRAAEDGGREVDSPYGVPIQSSDGAMSTLKRRFLDFERDVLARDEDYRSRLADAEKRYSDSHDSMTTQINNLTQSLTDHRNQLALTREELTKVQAQKAALTNDVARREERIEELEQEVREAELACAELQRAIEDREEVLNEVRRDLHLETEQKEMEIANIREAIESEAGLKIDKHRRDAEEIRTSLTTLQQTLVSRTNQLHQLNEQNNALNERVEQLTHALMNSRAECEAYRGVGEELEAAKGERNGAVTNLQELKEAVGNIRDVLAELCEDVCGEREEGGAESDIDVILKHLSTLDNAWSKMQEKSTKDAEEFASAKKDLLEAQQRVEHMESLITTMDQSLAADHQQLEIYSEQVGEAHHALSKLTRRLHLRDMHIKALRQALDDRAVGYENLVGGLMKRIEELKGAVVEGEGVFKADVDQIDTSSDADDTNGGEGSSTFARLQFPDQIPTPPLRLDPNVSPAAWRGSAGILRVDEDIQKSSTAGTFGGNDTAPTGTGARNVQFGEDEETGRRDEDVEDETETHGATTGTSPATRIPPVHPRWPKHAPKLWKKYFDFSSSSTPSTSATSTPSRQSTDQRAVPGTGGKIVPSTATGKNDRVGGTGGGTLTLPAIDASGSADGKEGKEEKKRSWYDGRFDILKPFVRAVRVGA
ncbi:hypothetical protein HDV00_010818 [Rhizophlyctis rosea]|nr:hypothetical protein HDV00_010818 [Rhizophlyctis rosea]